jgi:hypothetical protein
MSVKRRKFIFELSTKEKENKLKTVLSAEMEKTAAQNQPIVYRNELCITPNLFIHQYPDGRKELIEQDPQNSEEKTLMILT